MANYMKFGKLPRLYFAKDFGLEDFPHPLYPEERVLAYPSVTSITDCVKSAMAFAWWGANSAVDWIEKINMDTYLLDQPAEFDAAEFIADIQEARTAYLRISKEARDKGTNIHKLCEYYLTQDTWKLKELYDKSGDNEKKLFDNFIKWVKEHKIITFQTETKIIGDGYGGRFDWLCELDGTPTLIDLKTGKSGRWYDEWPLQIAGYKIGLNDGMIPESTICADTCGVLKLNKDTLTVNYKNYGNCDDYYQSFKHLVRFYWSVNEKEIEEEIEKGIKKC